MIGWEEKISRWMLRKYESVIRNYIYSLQPSVNWNDGERMHVFDVVAQGTSLYRQ